MWFFRCNHRNLQNHWTLDVFRKKNYKKMKEKFSFIFFFIDRYLYFLCLDIPSYRVKEVKSRCSTWNIKIGFQHLKITCSLILMNASHAWCTLITTPNLVRQSRKFYGIKPGTSPTWGSKLVQPVFFSLKYLIQWNCIWCIVWVIFDIIIINKVCSTQIYNYIALHIEKKLNTLEKCISVVDSVDGFQLFTAFRWWEFDSRRL